jgi:integrase
MALTELNIKNAKPKAKPYKLSDGDGMFLLISPAGGKHWRLKFRFLGKEKALAMGSYPEISLADARERRFEARKLLANGIDPSAKKQQAKQGALDDAAMTLELVARKWMEKIQKGLSEKYMGFIISRLEKDILSELGKKPISSITPRQVIEVLQAVEARGANEVARRLKQSLDEIFRYARTHELTTNNPMADLKSREVFERYKKGHYASIEIDEIPAFMKALRANKGRLYPLTQMAVELLMLTFVRTSELIEAKWSEIDWKEKQWVIPAERMKMGRDHIVPLSTQALAILEQLKIISGHREFIFPGQVNPRKSMSNNTILQALEGMGYKGKMTGHGFRSLAMSTIKEKLDYRHEVVDRQLAHAPKNKIDAAYDRAKFLKDRRVMMQEWADYIDKASKS